MRLIIGNLDPSLIESDLQRLFTPYGEIHSVEIQRDKWTNRSQGRAYVEMPVPEEARTAIAKLNGYSFARRSLTVVAAPGE